jgi:hypothetical protein
VPPPLAMCILKEASAASADAIARQVPAPSPLPPLACAHTTPTGSWRAHTDNQPHPPPLQMHLTNDMLCSKAEVALAGCFELLDDADVLPATPWRSRSRLVGVHKIFIESCSTSHGRQKADEMAPAWTPGCVVGLAGGSRPWRR